MAELAAPVREKAEQEVARAVEDAERKLWEIVRVDLGKKALKVADQIAAIKTLAQLRGWNALEKTESKVTVERIELVIVDPPTRSGTNL
jgi:hypothetical protein